MTHPNKDINTAVKHCWTRMGAIPVISFFSGWGIHDQNFCRNATLEDFLRGTVQSEGEKGDFDIQGVQPWGGGARVPHPLDVRTLLALPDPTSPQSKHVLPIFSPPISSFRKGDSANIRTSYCDLTKELSWSSVKLIWYFTIKPFIKYKSFNNNEQHQ